VLTYHPNLDDTGAVPLGFASDWQFPYAITTFTERLYVLDLGARQIWKYYPEGDGFIQQEDERTLEFSENPSLETAVDLAIYSEDGSLVVIYNDGRLRYYDTRSGRVQWDEAHLLQNGLGSPLVSPTAVEIVGRGLNASIFIADPGSGRIIEVSRGGTVLAQYRASSETGLELFGSISDFAITKSPLRVFVTANNQLYLATQD
jgi:flagellar basal body rod protein FlgG